MATVLEALQRKALRGMIREIAFWFGFKSTGTVRDYLKVLTKKGFLKVTPKKSRSIELTKNITFKIPILGQITTGLPNLA